MKPGQTCWLVVKLCTVNLGIGVVSRFVPDQVRPLAVLFLMSIATMLGVPISRARLSQKLVGTVLATIISVSLISAWRSLNDSIAILGAVPRSLEFPALAVLGGVVIVQGGMIALVFADQSRPFRSRWIELGAMVALLGGICGMVAHNFEGVYARQALLQRVVILEQSPDLSNWAERQELSTALAVLGRQREARLIALRPADVGQSLIQPPPQADPKSEILARPWREAVTQIAAEHRLVLIMEAHTISEHREWIDQSLPLFRAAGFTRYLAETVDESGSSLQTRGFPNLRTGTYTVDPRFGNLLRTALRLGMEIGGYDRFEPEFERREEFQATTIAREFSTRPDLKMVVHCGHAHVFKHEQKNVGRWMAARLFEKTGVEPFTVWQLSNDLDNDVYRDLIRQLGPIKEPVVLVAPPRDVSERLFPESRAHPAVDAIVIHPPDIGQEPTHRRSRLADQLTRVAGIWQGNQWPVVIAAIPVGEPDDAVAIDQVMLRPGETEFELWVPNKDFSLRVWGLGGRLESTSLRIVPNPGK